LQIFLSPWSIVQGMTASAVFSTVGQPGAGKD
jgi:hypothetical protein